MKWRPIKLTREHLEERRLEADRLLKAGQLWLSQSAKHLGVSRRAVSYWARRYRSGGLKRLQQRVATGRPPKRTLAQKRTLKQPLKRGALSAGFATDRWAWGRIATLIGREWGVRYHPSYLPRLLRPLGFRL